jgi:hypothetical protein
MGEGRGFAVVMEMKKVPNRNHLFSIVAAVIFISVVAFIFFRTSAMPIFGDYAEWTYHGVLLRDVLQGHPDAGYILKNYPVPNSMSTLGLGLLMLLMPWKIAAKVWLIGEACLGLFAAIQLQRASGSLQGWKLWVLPAAMLFGTTFWGGFSDFNIGTYFAMLICALLFRRAENLWLYTFLFLAVFFSHMIPFAFAVLALGLYAWQNAKWRLAWSVVPTLLLSLWYFAGRFAHGNADDYQGVVASVLYRQFPLFMAYKVNSYLKCWGFANPAATVHDSILLRLAGDKVFIFLFLLCVVVAAGLLVLMTKTGWRSIRTRGDQSFFWIAVGVFFVAGLALPGAAAGVSDPGGRLIELAAWSGLCVVSTSKVWIQRMLAGCALVLMISDCFLLNAVAMRPSVVGTEKGPLPAHVREFAHIVYSARYSFYVAIDQRKMTEHIFPTAMFLETGPHGNRTTN